LATSFEDKNKILNFIEQEKFIENLMNCLLVKEDCSAGSVKGVKWKGSWPIRGFIFIFIRMGEITP